MPSEKQVLHLLHIDDNEAERRFVEQAIIITQTPFLLFQADCIEAATLYFAQNDEEYPRPSMVLLDFEIGNHTGADFLYWLRGVMRIKSVPVVVLSGSVDGKDIADCYALGANFFISKPNSLTRLKNLVRTLHLSLLPHRGPSPILALHEYKPDTRKRERR